MVSIIVSMSIIASVLLNFLFERRFHFFDATFEMKTRWFNRQIDNTSQMHLYSWSTVFKKLPEILSFVEALVIF